VDKRLGKRDGANSGLAAEPAASESEDCRTKKKRIVADEKKKKKKRR
jgi:hypothetical protein